MFKFSFLLALLGGIALSGSLRAEEKPATVTKEVTLKIMGMT